MDNPFYVQPSSGWGQGLSQIASQIPQATQQRRQGELFKNEQTKENYIQSMFKAIQNPEDIPNIAARRIEYLKSQGLSPEEMVNTVSVAERYKQDPEGSVKGIIEGMKKELAFLAPKRWLAYRKAIGELKKGIPPTPTDIDDFVEDANKESIRLTNKELTPGQKNKARLEFKRAQVKEVRANRFAEREVDRDTAEKIKFNEEIGKNLARIETAGKLIAAKGEISPQAKIDRAKKRMAGNLSTLANHYINLDSTGAMLNVNNNTFTNVLSAMRSSSLGQQFGRITGSNEQSIRNSIKKLKPLIIQDIRQSTDMGARGLDSEKELEFYLQAATDEKTDIQSNIAAIVVLDEAFGNGEIASQLRNLTNESLVKRIANEGNIILKGVGEKSGGTTKDDDEYVKQLLEKAGVGVNQ